ncbi:helicase-related protein [Rothia nasimurium]|uniref:helicase-related protein n=1 Tax=Rothia nasimurium TaxID=85336 RepID=UPI003613A831
MVQQIAPGSLVRVRDESWLVTQVSSRGDQRLVHVIGLSELVRDTEATFIDDPEIDTIEVEDPRLTKVVADDSSRYKRSRLWLEATLRKTQVPLPCGEPVIADQMMLDALPYQKAAVRKALDSHNIRPRILLADAVGLGKTLEIGMILSELIRRGRGERILVVAPAHVLEQFQHELWTRFALPLVRLDSVGIQRIRQEVPSTKNPFSVIKRAIVSLDTLKSQKYLNHLRKVQWDAVVIDESHNLTNAGTQNNQLARVLAPNTDALILASATPHNGRAESFAELIRLLDPTAVDAQGKVQPEALDRLVIRRHRNSPEVAQYVGNDWKTRKEPVNRLVQASAAENAIAEELAEVWLHPGDGREPVAKDRLSAWTLAKAFLSSNAAFKESLRNRANTLAVGVEVVPEDSQKGRELAAIRRLQGLAERAEDEGSSKLEALVEYLKEIGISSKSATRVVIFSERVATLGWLKSELQKALKLKPEQVDVLHGGLDDQTQQNVIESFKMKNSPVRVLVTGDVASEGVNLHAQCHYLVHFDIPWSLIRIEQRNGRIDRYGQKEHPEIVTLLLNPTHEKFRGDIRVLGRLMEREHEAHEALGSAASLMGQWSAHREEQEIIKVLEDQQTEAETFAEVQELDANTAWLTGGSDFDDFFASFDLDDAEEAPQPGGSEPGQAEDYVDASLYESSLDFLRDAVEEMVPVPSAAVERGGFEWEEFPSAAQLEMVPPADLRKRLRALPQTYLQARQVMEKLVLATTPERGQQSLIAAREGEKSQSKFSGVAGTWPEAHYLSPLHPVLDWASDRVLSTVARQQILAVRADVDAPTMLLLGTYMNKNGQIMQRSFYEATFMGSSAMCSPVLDIRAYLDGIGLTAESMNPGPVELPGEDELARMMGVAVDVAQETFESMQKLSADQAATRLKDLWKSRIDQWADRQGLLPGGARSAALKLQGVRVDEERQLAEKLEPSQHLIRPLLLVFPQGE